MASFQNRKQSTVPITQKKLTQSILQCQLAFDDPEPAPITSLFSVDSPLTLDLSAQEQNFEDFLSVGKETTPSVLPVPITYQYFNKILTCGR